MKKQNIEDIFSSMEDFSSVPPPELWGQIEEKLDKPKKKRRAVIWWSAAACLMIGLGLTTVLRFNSASGIKINNSGAVENSVVLEDQKDDLNKTRTIVAPENKNIENSSNTENVSSSKNEINNTQKSQNQEIQTAASNSKNKTSNGILDPKAKNEKENVNHAVAEKTFVPANKNTFSTVSKKQTLENNKAVSNQAVAEKTFVPANENTFNTVSKKQPLENNKVVSNQAVAEKTYVPAKENTFGTVSKKQPLENKNAVSNQAVAEKTFVPAKENTFGTVSKKQPLENNKVVSKQAVAEKTFVPAKENTFGTVSKNQIASNKTRNTNKAIAEQKVVFGKESKFNSTPKKQLSTSIFDDDKATVKTSKNLASNALNPVLSGKQNTAAENISKQQNGNSTTDKAVASTLKDNSKFDAVLSKQDSVQLAELQNLEKGITVPEPKTEKETKATAKSEKWAVAVFAGVASSENYKNEKTLGNVNDSKQSSTYGVKTKYKINNKWAVASGFKINELGQSVANVSYMSAKNNAFFTSGDFYLAQNSAAPAIASNRDYILVTTNAKEVLNSDNIQSGSLDQSLRYIEMPLEVSYSIFNKNKASINLNTGGFVGKLISNHVALDGTAIGQNVNANDYVYGSTISSTLQYRIYKKTNIFAEPTMNYYINPLSNQSFNQFQWGLNFGLNVSF